MTRTRSQRGYSLIEALVVIGMIGIITVITVPNFIAMFRTMRIKGAVRQFAQDVRAARQHAVSKNVPTMVTLSTATTGRYLMYERVNGAWVLYPDDRQATKDLQPNTADTNKRVFFTSIGFTDLERSDGQKDIEFQPNGTLVLPASPATPTLKIATTDSVPKPSYTVTISTAGQVSVK